MRGITTSEASLVTRLIGIRRPQTRHYAAGRDKGDCGTPRRDSGIQRIFGGTKLGTSAARKTPWDNARNRALFPRCWRRFAVGNELSEAHASRFETKGTIPTRAVDRRSRVREATKPRITARDRDSAPKTKKTRVNVWEHRKKKKSGI